MKELDLEHLEKYFKTIWKSNLDQYTYSGWALLDRVSKDEHILDVGCGFNEFKKYLPNLIGIDPYNSNADIMVSIEEYQTTQEFDVIFCLGSINFGNQNIIESQIKKIVSLLKPGGKIYWRQNPGYHDHESNKCKKIKFYEWTFMDNYSYAYKNNCRVEFIDEDCNRLYAEWMKCKS